MPDFFIGITVDNKWGDCEGDRFLWIIKCSNIV